MNNNNDTDNLDNNNITIILFKWNCPLYKYIRLVLFTHMVFCQSTLYVCFYYYCSYKIGKTNAPETLNSKQREVHIFYDHVPDELVPPPGAPRTKWVFLTAVGQTKNEALQAYTIGKGHPSPYKLSTCQCESPAPPPPPLGRPRGHLIFENFFF